MGVVPLAVPERGRVLVADQIGPVVDLRSSIPEAGAVGRANPAESIAAGVVDGGTIWPSPRSHSILDLRGQPPARFALPVAWKGGPNPW